MYKYIQTSKQVKFQKTNTIRVDIPIYYRYCARIKNFKILNKDQLLKTKNFFFWIFHIIKLPRFSLVQLKRRLKSKDVVRFERKTAPVFNLRVYALYARIMKHGKSEKAKVLIFKLIRLLTENTKKHSGCFILGQALRAVEPAIGLLTYRRGKNFYSMPVPVWPSRKLFLAAKFLVKGAKRRQQIQRCSFLMALYLEVLDVVSKKKDCFTLKIFKMYRKKILKVETQAWRNKKKKF